MLRQMFVLFLSTAALGTLFLALSFVAVLGPERLPEGLAALVPAVLVASAVADAIVGLAVWQRWRFAVPLATAGICVAAGVQGWIIYAIEMATSDGWGRAFASLILYAHVIVAVEVVVAFGVTVALRRKLKLDGVLGRR